MDNHELIKKYLERWKGLEVASIEHYAKTGKVSGFLYLAIEKMLDEKAREAFEAAREVFNERPSNVETPMLKYKNYEAFKQSTNA